MYQRNDKGQIIGACVLGVFLFFGNMYMSYANTMSVLEEAADYADESYQERNQQILNTTAKESDHVNIKWMWPLRQLKQ